MSQRYSSQTSARLAMLLLRELAYRGGRAKLRYLKTYRAILEWGSEDYASYILNRLKEGSLVKVEGDYVALTGRVQPGNPIKLAEEARALLIREGS
ncbi:MAG: hypothetical protein RQ838_01930 [Caldivirga sp.]|nr:hypothetical protein [Caldivirga sp.]